MNKKLLIPIIALIVSGCILNEQKKQVEAEETLELIASVSVMPEKVSSDTLAEENHNTP